jgi:hypothetical protein
VVHRRLIVGVFFAIAIALVPWTFWLVQTLPSHSTTEHWRAAWTGFDIALSAAMLLVGFAALRNSVWLEAAAAATGALLLCDAWFDMLLESGNRFWIAVGEAVIAEIPFALVCFWIARDAERFLASVVRAGSARRAPDTA